MPSKSNQTKASRDLLVKRHMTMSVTEAPRAAANLFEGVTPIFRVRSLRTGIDDYVNVLGFKVAWEDPGSIASSHASCASLGVNQQLDGRFSLNTKLGSATGALTILVGRPEVAIIPNSNEDT